ncbi:hypothetical protein JTE90_002762 [Oedothorax gibbosus]|uniref:CCAAT-binding factor domain-containing protein n=1 Tax=Oedothorax gibbosus TaxID=931172 RepID=A0AAV6UNF4_9ARAC|nr:hypothetical protein JTE90_002762 [Oedothorax gibbosus]
MLQISDFDPFFRSKKNANCILQLEKTLLSDDDSCVLSSIDLFKEVFTQIFKQGMLKVPSQEDNKDEKFRSWLTSSYNDMVLHLLCYLVHENSKIQENSLGVLMTMVALEGENSNKEGWFFPNNIFQKIVNQLASQDVDQQSLIAAFQNYTCYDDIKTYLLKAILKIFTASEQVTDIFLGNMFSLLCTIKYPKEFTEESNTHVSVEGFCLKKKLFCKLFTSAWQQFLKYTNFSFCCKLPTALLKRVLLVLHKKALPHIQNPCSLTDFLTEAYTQGGVLSLLSLNGLFYLIDKQNVEYPDFFLKLYSLFDREIVNGKFSARFFYLSDLFLSSTHLPAYLVASFVKKISRIALSSTTEVILRILPFVCNILIRNPTLKSMVHRTSPQELSSDPFILEAMDPVQSKALESSLWEIKTLQNHVHPEVSSKAKLINHELPIMELGLARVLDTTIEYLYGKERKRKFTDVPAAVQKPATLQSWWTI